MATAASSKKPKAMPKKNLVHFEKRLLEERKRVLKELGHYDETFGSTPQGADGDLSAYSFHMADQGTDAMEREKAFLFASQEGRFLWHIDEALRRRVVEDVRRHRPDDRDVVHDPDAVAQALGAECIALDDLDATALTLRIHGRLESL